MNFSITGNDVADWIMVGWVLCCLAVFGWFILGEKPLIEEDEDD